MTNPSKSNPNSVVKQVTVSGKFLDAKGNKLTAQGLDTDDVVFGGDAADTVKGGGGADILHGGQGHDLLWGERGNDTLFGNQGADRILGGPGNDSINGGLGNDLVNGGPGNDTVQGGKGRDTVLGGDGDDHAAGHAGNDYVDGGDGNDFVFGDAGIDVLFGGAGNDFIESNHGHDRYVNGGTGNDFINFSFLRAPKVPVKAFKTDASGLASIGFSGASGGDDGDVVRGAGLVGFLSGGEGADLVDGSTANSNGLLASATTFDGVVIPKASTWLLGGQGPDILIGGRSNNVFFGDGDVVLDQDLINSRDMIDWISGWNNADKKSASIVAGVQNGYDTFGQDIFVVGSNFTFKTSGKKFVDTILHFDVGNDKIDVSYVSFSVDELLQKVKSTTFKGAKYTLGLENAQDGKGALLHFPDNNGNQRTVFVHGASASDLKNSRKSTFDIDASKGSTLDLIFGQDGTQGATVEIVQFLSLPKRHQNGDPYVEGEALDIASRTVTEWNPKEHKTLAATGIDLRMGNTVFADREVKGPSPKQFLGFGHDVFFDGGEGFAVSRAVAGGDGQDILIGFGGNDSLHGDDQSDLIAGGGGHDLLEGNRKADLIFGQTGNDFVLAGLGNDVVDAGAGNDTIKADFGDDIVRGNSGNDVIDGGAGNDLLHGDGFLEKKHVETWKTASFFAWGEDSSPLRTEVDDKGDLVRVSIEHLGETYSMSVRLGVGKHGDDLIFGGFGDDVIFGGGRNDTLHGGAGDDLLRGDAGNDILRGGSGNDHLKGGKGNDHLIGGFGNDVLEGGQGSDVYEFGQTGDLDVVKDFKPGADKIVVWDSGGVILRENGADALVMLSDGTRVLVEGVSHEALTVQEVSVGHWEIN